MRPTRLPASMTIFGVTTRSSRAPSRSIRHCIGVAAPLLPLARIASHTCEASTIFRASMLITRSPARRPAAAPAPPAPAPRAARAPAPPRLDVAEHRLAPGAAEPDALHQLGIHLARAERGEF